MLSQMFTDLEYRTLQAKPGRQRMQDKSASRSKKKNKANTRSRKDQLEYAPEQKESSVRMR